MLILSARGYTIHTEGGVTVAYAPDEDLLAARKEWLRFAPLMAAAPQLADALREAARLTREGNLYKLKKLFASAEMQHLINETRKEL